MPPSACALPAPAVGTTTADASSVEAAASPCSDGSRRHNLSRRDVVLTRWGGLGSHRYQYGHTGDAKHDSWDSLAFQPAFSLGGTNVLFGLWSHDISGGKPGHEDANALAVRWLQWGTVSSIFRVQSVRFD